MPSHNHSLIQVRIAGAFDAAYADKFNTHAELSLNLTTGKATPDVSLYPAKPGEWFHDEKTVTTAPIMALEILSPTQGTEDLTEKMDLYFGAGVQSYWVVIPPFRTIHIISPDRKYKTFTEGIAKDPILEIELDMAKIFR